jgi:3-hydroxyisobutyrate dehydrogenase-like beta-hydroxyacid dehydrogenase
MVDAARQQTAPHGTGHVEEVFAHRELRLGRTAGDHGLDDRRVLGHGRRRSARDQDRAVLVAHRLRVQGVDESDSGRMAGELQQGGVQVGVRVRCPEEIPAVEELTLACETGLETGDAGMLDSSGGLADGEALEDGARLQDLDRLVVTDAPHAGASMRLANDEPVLLETDERRAHGAARHVERRGDVGLDEAGVGSDLTADDCLAEGVVGRGDRHRATRILPECREDRQQFCFHVGVDRSGAPIEPTERPPVSPPVVAVLGLGEAGGRLAADLVSVGVDVRGYDPLTTSAQNGVAQVGDPVAAASASTVVLALTTASAALAAAESALPGLRTGAIYADLNTTSPALKHDIAALVAETGARFADVALLGPVPARGLGTPALASGLGAHAFAEAFRPLGMPVDVVSDRPGDAATLKLLRSVFMKGLAASALESLRAADAAGHASWLEGEIAAVIGEPLLERLVEGSRRHAVRRVDEMAAAHELLLELGVEPRIVAASASVLAELAASEGTGGR